jgi:hypothetical protein
MDKVQKHNSFNTNTPSSESYKNYLKSLRLYDPYYSSEAGGGGGLIVSGESEGSKSCPSTNYLYIYN